MKSLRSEHYEWTEVEYFIDKNPLTFPLPVSTGWEGLKVPQTEVSVCAIANSGFISLYGGITALELPRSQIFLSLTNIFARFLILNQREKKNSYKTPYLLVTLLCKKIGLNVTLLIACKQRTLVLVLNS